MLDTPELEGLMLDTPELQRMIKERAIKCELRWMQKAPPVLLLQGEQVFQKSLVSYWYLMNKWNTKPPSGESNPGSIQVCTAR